MDNITSDELTARAGELNRYDDDLGISNRDEVLFRLTSECGVSRYRASGAMARAARLYRFRVRPPTEMRMTPAGAAIRFGASGSNIRRACALGLLKAEKVGRAWMFGEEDYLEWQKNGKHKPGKEGKNG
jgi:hypothetical protein